MSLGVDLFEPRGEDQIKEITGKVTFADGEVVEFRMTPDGIHRWGNTRRVIGRAVLPLDEMELAISNEGLWTA